MSKYAEEYRNADPLVINVRRTQYMEMLRNKADIERYGANLLAQYNARKSK